jgi:dihydroorotate dehydrogenase
MSTDHPHLLPRVHDLESAFLDRLERDPEDDRSRSDRRHWESAFLARLKRDHDRFARAGLPQDLEGYLLESYALDVTASYAGIELRNPWGKASGQLSLNRVQIEEAADAGLAFVVLKTVIAQDSAGGQTMADWAIKESHMVVEPITGRSSGTNGWTVTWNGRGWCRSFEDYLTLVREASTIGGYRDLLVVPSVKYHLPAPGESSWREEEYQFTTRAIVDAHVAHGAGRSIAIEKDFSPTLAGSARSLERAKVLEWLRRVPELIRSAARPADRIKLGLKLNNTLEDDDFQLRMLAEVHRSESRPDFLVYANRLYDPDRVFEEKRGAAYGGPDLSDRNLRVLSQLRAAQERGEITGPPLPLSATGDISSGRIAVEYLLRGCTSFQIHTLFQLPASEYAMRRGTKVEKALHRLYFDPIDGFIVWALYAARRLELARPGERVRLLDIAHRGASSALTRRQFDSEPT